MLLRPESSLFNEDGLSFGSTPRRTYNGRDCRTLTEGNDVFGLRFLEASRDLSLALTGQVVPFLVVLSLLIACLASYSCLGLLERAEQSRRERSLLPLVGKGGRRWWLGAAGMLGLGIWAMHSVGTLAFRLLIPTGYDAGLTLLSLLPALTASAIVLAFLLRPSLPHIEICLLSVLLSLGIVAMHLLGFSGLHLEVEVVYDRGLLLLAALGGISSMTLAVYTARWAWCRQDRQPLFGRRCLAGLTLGGAIASTHYLGRNAIYCFPVPNLPPSLAIDSLDPQIVGALLASAVLLILGLALFVSVVDRRIQDLRISTGMGRDLSQALESASEGFSLFDPEARLVFANAQLRKLLKLEDLASGTRFDQIIGMFARRGRTKVAEDRLDAWIQERLELCRNPESGMIHELEDGPWIRIRANPTDDGGTVVVYTDITAFKKTKRVPGQREKLQERQTLEEALLKRASEMGATATDFQDALQEIMDLICQLTEWPEGHVYEVNRGQLTLAPIWFDRSLVRLDQIRKLVTRKNGKVGTPLAHSILESAELTLVADSAKVQTLRKHVSPAIQQAAGIPVRVGSEIVVILEFLSDHHHHLNPNLSGVLAQVARQLGRVYERQQALSEVPSAAEPVADQPASVSAEPVSIGRDRPGRFLVVDATEKDRIRLSRLVEELGHQAYPAASTEEALKLMQEQTFDLVLMDLKMPEIDGQTPLQILREDDPQRRQQILALTATLFPDMLSRVRASGFDGFLTKSVQRVELEKTIRQFKTTPFSPSGPESTARKVQEEGFDNHPIPRTARVRLSKALDSGDLRVVSEVAEELKKETGSRPLGNKISQLALQFDFTELKKILRDSEE